MVVNFQNKLDSPVTMHPHGIFYAQEMDGAYKGKFTDPGGFVQKKPDLPVRLGGPRGHRGRLALPRPRADGPAARSTRACSGRCSSAPPAPTPPNQEFFSPSTPSSRRPPGSSDAFSCINGRAYAGNTPTLRASVGERVAFHVFAIDNDFHTFHIHGHRWTDPTGTVIDNKTLGPGDSITAEFVEDNPGAGSTTATCSAICTRG